MDKGVVGFRFDALRHLFESDLFLDEPCLEGKDCSIIHDNMNHTYTVDQPENIEIINQWRVLTDNYSKSKNKSVYR